MGWQLHLERVSPEPAISIGCCVEPSGMGRSTHGSLLAATPSFSRHLFTKVPMLVLGRLRGLPSIRYSVLV